MGIGDQGRATIAPATRFRSARRVAASDAIRSNLRLFLQGIMRSFEDDLQRLGLARIDILYVHDVGAREHRDAYPEVRRTFRKSGYRALEELRSSGTVNAIGIGVNEWEVLDEALEWGAWDVFLLAGRYTLLEQTAIEKLLPKCLRIGISVIIGAPFNTGVLAGRDSWNYQPAPREIVDRVNAIRAVCDDHHVPLIAAALQFPLDAPADGHLE